MGGGQFDQLSNIRCRGDPRHHLHLRVVQRSRLERSIELWEVRDRSRDPELFTSCAFLDTRDVGPPGSTRSKALVHPTADPVEFGQQFELLVAADVVGRGGRP